MIEISEREFQEAVSLVREAEGRIKEEKISFVQAIYQVLDAVMAENIKSSGLVLICKSGCSTCCNQLVTCTQIEMDEIIRFIDFLPREKRIPLLRRMRDAVIQWRDYFNKEGHLLKFDQLKYWRDWFGKPCPFLNSENGACDIYSVRIIDCRTLTSTIRCDLVTDDSAEKPKRFRFKVETFANNMVFDEQKRISALRKEPIGVTPLRHLLWTRRKELGY